MWEVSVEQLSVYLPEGFSLKEDEDFVYLYYGDTRVAIFSATGAKPKEIRKEAEKYLQNLQ